MTENDRGGSPHTPSNASARNEISVDQDFFHFRDIDKKMTLVKFHPFLLFDQERDFISPTPYIVQPEIIIRLYFK